MSYSFFGSKNQNNYRKGPGTSRNAKLWTKKLPTRMAALLEGENEALAEDEDETPPVRLPDGSVLLGPDAPLKRVPRIKILRWIERAGPRCLRPARASFQAKFGGAARVFQ